MQELIGGVEPLQKPNKQTLLLFSLWGGEMEMVFAEEKPEDEEVEEVEDEEVDDE